MFTKSNCHLKYNTLDRKIVASMHGRSRGHANQLYFLGRVFDFAWSTWLVSYPLVSCDLVGSKMSICLRQNMLIYKVLFFTYYRDKSMH